MSPPGANPGPVPDNLRDWFAGQAVGSLILNTTQRPTAISVAYEAYEVADAMLEAREKSLRRSE